MPRTDGRSDDELRSVRLTPKWSKFAEGSCLIEIGDTRVLCTASVVEGVPKFLEGRGSGWVTGEYGMLPRSTNTRTVREAAQGKPSGRTQEIQRLIGRSLRSVTNLSALGERTIWLDCDVLQADGGTRTAAVTGSYVALVQALGTLRSQGLLGSLPVSGNVAAVSVGIVDGRPMLDLNYAEDASATVDMNVVMTLNNKLIEVQSTAERGPFTRDDLLSLLDLASAGIGELIAYQDECLGQE